ncbi:MAG: chromate resistance protein [Burkholderiaceae bacterium]|nr:chromate resistance protein [Burkholderiaceae bacterium]
MNGNACTARELQSLLAGDRPPLLIDVRRAQALREAGARIGDAQWRDPSLWLSWKDTLDQDRLLLYCVHGREISQGLVAALRAMGRDARYLEGGYAAWVAEGLPVQALAPARPGSRWVTRERPKIDRIACSWLVTRFIDPRAEFLYVPAADVLRVAQETGAIPYDIPGVELSHVGERCSFDALLRKYELEDPALQQLATIVRGADTSRLDLAPQSAGLYAISLGLSRNFSDDHEMLRQGMVLYDALYAWCRQGQNETHLGPPAGSAKG